MTEKEALKLIDNVLNEGNITLQGKKEKLARLIVSAYNARRSNSLDDNYNFD